MGDLGIEIEIVVERWQEVVETFQLYVRELDEHVTRSFFFAKLCSSGIPVPIASWLAKRWPAKHLPQDWIFAEAENG